MEFDIYGSFGRKWMTMLEITIVSLKLKSIVKQYTFKTCVLITTYEKVDQVKVFEFLLIEGYFIRETNNEFIRNGKYIGFTPSLVVSSQKVVFNFGRETPLISSR
jgi:hypothetical protein